MKKQLLIGAIVLGLSGSTFADTLANWTFETSVPATAGPHAAEAGINAASSFASGVHASGSTVYSNPAGNGSAESFSSTHWAIGDYYQFTTSTTGFGNLSFSWHQSRSATGPATFDLAWSIDGSSFTTLVDNYVVPEATWSSGSTHAGSIFGAISAPAGLANQPLVYFRLIADSAASSTAGTNRVDNIVISATAVPLPLAVWGGLGLLVMAGAHSSRLRRRSTSPYGLLPAE